MSNLFVKSSWSGLVLLPGLEYDKNVHVFIDEIPTINDPNCVVIIVLQEPFTINVFLDTIYNNNIRYDYLFTYDENTLNNNSKAVEFMGTSTRISNYHFVDKSFSVSTLVGGKNFFNLDGYVLRHALWNAQQMITTPKRFFLSSESIYGEADYRRSLVLGNTKAPLFDSQFHITIENTSMKNMFTEKIIDAFQTKTAPIYYGARNIGDYFDERGIIRVTNLNEIIMAANSLTEETYEKMLPFVEANYQESMKYCNYDNSLIRIINKTLNGR